MGTVASHAGMSPAAADDVVPASEYFAGTIYLAHAEDLSEIDAGSQVGWNEPVVALARPGSQEDRLLAPDGAQSVVTFIAPQGEEADVGAWNASAPWQITPPGLLVPDVTPYHQIEPGTGAPSGTNATAAATGDYSIGVAYLDASGQRVAPGGLYFAHIHLTGNSDALAAAYTWQPVEASGEAPTTDASQPGDSPSAGVPGLLSFVAPVRGTMSEAVTIHDSRIDGPGWTLVASGAGPAAIVASGGPGASDGVAVAPSTAGGAVTLTLVSN